MKGAKSLNSPVSGGSVGVDAGDDGCTEWKGNASFSFTREALARMFRWTGGAEEEGTKGDTREDEHQEEEVVVGPVTRVQKMSPTLPVVVDEEERRQEWLELQEKNKKSREQEGQVNVLLEIALRDMLVPENTKSHLLRSQSLDQKRVLIKQHTNRKTHESLSRSQKSEPSQHRGLVFAGFTRVFDHELEQQAAVLRTADKTYVDQFLSESGPILFTAMRKCACKEPKVPMEVSILRHALECVNQLTLNRYGRLRVKDIPSSMETLALCIDVEALVTGEEGDSSAVAIERSRRESLGNCVSALDILVRLAWTERHGSSNLLRALEDAAVKVRRNVGGALSILSSDYVHCPLIESNPAELCQLALQTMTFLNSLVELEDNVVRRSALRRDIASHGLVNASRVLVEYIQQRKSRGAASILDEIKMQIDIFEVRLNKDVERFGPGKTREVVRNEPTPTPIDSAVSAGGRPGVLPGPPSPISPGLGTRRPGKSSQSLLAAEASCAPSDLDEAGMPCPGRSSEWERVAAILDAEGLGQYKNALFDWGYDTVDRLFLVECSELVELGMKRGHAKAFQLALLRSSNATAGSSTASTVSSSACSWQASSSESGPNREEHRRWSEALPSANSQSDGSVQKEILATHQPFQFKVIPSAALSIKELVGRGSFGDVHRCEYQGAICVVKRVKRSPNRPSQQLSNKEILKEANAMEHCKNHPHVVNLYGVCIDGEEIMLVSEYCEEGSLYRAVVQPPVAHHTVPQRLKLARQGVSGLVHLHSLHVVHRDIAARNFLLTRSGIVKVCDFGLAKIKSTTSKKHGSYSAGDINPLRWAAPESLSDNEYSSASDVYMTGCFLWELWFRAVPFAELDNIQAAMQVTKGVRPHVDPESESLFPGLAHLLRSCWQAQKSDRPDMTSVMQTLSDLIALYELGGALAYVRPTENLRSVSAPALPLHPYSEFSSPGSFYDT